MIPPLLSFLKKTKQPLELTLMERLPAHLIPPCVVTCHWTLNEQPDYALWTFTLDAKLALHCQRCAEPFITPFFHQNSLMICQDLDTLNRHNNRYECVLWEELPNNLTDLVIDELYLFSPDRHAPSCP